jgi:hypothetical protein
MKKGLMTVLVLCLLALVAIPACAPAEPQVETIKIGVIGPMANGICPRGTPLAWRGNGAGRNK